MDETLLKLMTVLSNNSQLTHTAVRILSKLTHEDKNELLKWLKQAENKIASNRLAVLKRYLYSDSISDLTSQ